MRNAGQLSVVLFDSRLQVMQHAAGYTRIARVQERLKTKREIRVATVFREMPQQFLQMIVVHRLAHLKEGGHDKTLPTSLPAYGAGLHQLEFDLRTCLCYLDAAGAPLWSGHYNDQAGVLRPTARVP